MKEKKNEKNNTQHENVYEAQKYIVVTVIVILQRSENG